MTDTPPVELPTELPWDDILADVRGRLTAQVVDAEERRFCPVEKATFSRCMASFHRDSTHEQVERKCSKEVAALEACTTIDIPERRRAAAEFTQSAEKLALSDERCAYERGFLQAVRDVRAQADAGQDNTLGQRYFQWGGPETAVSAARYRLAVCGAALKLDALAAPEA